MERIDIAAQKKILQDRLFLMNFYNLIQEKVWKVLQHFDGKKFTPKPLQDLENQLKENFHGYEVSVREGNGFGLDEKRYFIKVYAPNNGIHFADRYELCIDLEKGALFNLAKLIKVDYSAKIAELQPKVDAFEAFAQRQNALYDEIEAMKASFLATIPQELRGFKGLIS